MSRSPVRISALPPGGLLGGGERAEQVVGLEVVGVGDRPAERLVERGRQLPLVGQVVRHRRAVGVVRRVAPRCGRRRLGPEAHHHGARLVALDAPQRRVDRAQQRVDGPPVGARDRVGQRRRRRGRAGRGRRQTSSGRRHDGQYVAPCARSTDSRNSRRPRVRSSAPATGTRSPRRRSTPSPTSPATTSGSTSIPSVPRTTPFGGTIAHGYYTLSLAPCSARRSWTSRASRSASTTASTRSASRRRCRSAARCAARSAIAEVAEIPGGAQVKFEHTFEREGGDKPVCVAEALARFYAG